MALHKLFQDQANRAAFLEAFELWYRQTTSDMKKLESGSQQRYDYSHQQNDRGDIEVIETETCTSKLYKAIKKIKTPSGRPADSKTYISKALNKAAQSLDVFLTDIERHYGYENYMFETNARVHIDALAFAQKAALFHNVDIVRELLDSADNVVDLASTVDRRKASNFVGPIQPQQSQQEASAGAQLG